MGNAFANINSNGFGWLVKIEFDRIAFFEAKT